METAKKITRSVEVSESLAGAFVRACTAAGVDYAKTYTNGGVTVGYSLKGEAVAVRRLILKYQY